MADQWFYKRNGAKLGPVSLGDLRRLAASGGLTPQDEIFREGMIGWASAGSMTALFASTARAESLPASTPTVAAKVPVPASTSGPTRTPTVSRPKEPTIPLGRPTSVAAPVPPPPPHGVASPATSTAATSDQVRKPVQPFWVGLALCLFFPLGFILLAMHPTLRNRKAWWAAGIAWALLVVLAPRPESDDTVGENSSTSASTQIEIHEREKSSTRSGGSDRPKGTRAVGDTFTLGEFKYCITGVHTTSRIGKTVFGEFMGEQASPGAIFVIVSYTIENVGSESQTVLSDDFKIKDSGNRTFKPSSDANVALLMESGDKDFLLSELQPGLSRAMKQAFQLPEKALESPITVIVPKKGLFASGEERVHVSVR